VAMSTPPVVSSTFFPMNQRATATSIMAVSNYLGVALTFLIGPLMVPNEPRLANVTPGEEWGPAFGNNSQIMQNRRDETLNYLLGQTGLAALCLLATLIYFPSRPQNAPSVSATVDRTEHVNIAFFDRNLHARMSLVPTPACLKRTCV
jgi:FLVCR family MFS transporter